MKFEQIINRLTGLSTPIFGVSWSPPQDHIAIALKTITFLEDRRVLFNPFHMEDPRHCVESVITIRQFLTKEPAALSSDDGPSQNLRAMRAVCRKFLDAVQTSDDKGPLRGMMGFNGNMSNWIFNSALGELRGIIGLHVASLAAQHGLDVEGDLSTILPAEDNQ